jgi:hypothetical protein
VLARLDLQHPSSWLAQLGWGEADPCSFGKGEACRAALASAMYVGEDGLLRRHDHDIEIAGGTSGAHYISDDTKVAGIMMPTRHRIFPRSPGGQALAEPLMVAIDVSEIAFT